MGRDRRARVRRDAVHRAPPGRRRPDRRAGGEGLHRRLRQLPRGADLPDDAPRLPHRRDGGGRDRRVAARRRLPPHPPGAPPPRPLRDVDGVLREDGGVARVHVARRAVPLARRRVVRHADGGRRGDGRLLAAVCWYRPRPRPLGRDAFVLQGPRDRLAPLRLHGFERRLVEVGPQHAPRRVQRDRARPQHPAHAGARDHVESSRARASGTRTTASGWGWTTSRTRSSRTSTSSSTR